jgi:hypothetical protein
MAPLTKAEVRRLLGNDRHQPAGDAGELDNTSESNENPAADFSWAKKALRFGTGMAAFGFIFSSNQGLPALLVFLFIVTSCWAVGLLADITGQ